MRLIFSEILVNVAVISVDQPISQFQNLDGNSDAIEVNELLRNRAQFWPLEKVIARDLPNGLDFSNLEKYLDDDDFQLAFKMNRNCFYSLPVWKQIEMRKKNKLF